MSIQKSMLLITSLWGEDKTFRMIPITPEAPYNEVIWDLDQQVLIVISKVKKDAFKTIQKLDDSGSPMYMKELAVNRQLKPKTERRIIETWYEYFVKETSEIKDFVNLFAINAETFDIASYLSKEATPVPTV